MAVLTRSQQKKEMVYFQNNPENWLIFQTKLYYKCIQTNAHRQFDEILMALE